MSTQTVFQAGDVKCEIIKGAAFSDTNATNFAHDLGIVPDIVIIANTGNQSYTLTPGTHTSSNIVITASNASATCDILIGKVKGKAR